MSSYVDELYDNWLSETSADYHAEEQSVIKYITIFPAKNGYTIAATDSNGDKENYIARDRHDLANVIDNLFACNDYDDFEPDEEEPNPQAQQTPPWGQNKPVLPKANKVRKR